MTTKIYGCSDDLIEFEGDIHDEIGCFDVITQLTFNDGTVLKVYYGKVIGGEAAGIWSVEVLHEGFLFDRKEECFDECAEIYSDIVYLKDGASLLEREVLEE